MRDQPAIAKHYLIIPWVFLLLGITLTYVLQNSARESARHALHDEFDFRSNEVIETIKRRMQNYEQILEGVSGLYAASEEVTRDEFVAYVRALRLEGKYPGIQGVGFSQVVQPKSRREHIRKVRASGRPGYDIRPSGERELYTAIVHLEPETARNQRAIGFDMYSEPVRRAAMSRARDENATAISGKVKLVQETEQDLQAGFLMYLPVYHLNTPHQTLEERRANLMGWAYAPFRAKDFMAGMMSSRFTELSTTLNLEFYAGHEVNEKNLMFDSSPDHAANPQAEFYVRKNISFYGQPATAVISALPAFNARLKSEKPNIILVAGTLASLLLAMVAWLLVTGRARAQMLAEKMTLELRQAAAVQQHLNRALHLISDCNTLIMHAHDEYRLLSEVCRLCVERGGYLMAWIGYAETDADKTVRPVAQSGYENGYLESINVTWADTERGRGPTGTAIRTGTNCVNMDVMTNPALAPWREAALRRGYRASIAVPIICDVKVLGALTIYAGEANAFDAEEIKLLEELARDLAYGILTLRTRAAHAAAEEKLDFLSNFDPLTQLPNRLLLRDRFEHAALAASSENGTVTLLYLDLDNFQQINDALGHTIGDQVLVVAVDRLRECILPTDTISRLSGDAFVILLEGKYDAPALAAIANRIREAFVDPVDINGSLLNISFSIGISQLPGDGSDFDTLLRHADTALNSAKEAGRNTFRFFTHAMSADFAEQIMLTGGLLNALRNEEFRLYYQPQIDLDSGHVISAEALIRWQHPVKGLIAPGRFIPLAERSGHIIKMGEWVLNEACRQAKHWLDTRATPLVVAVNLSAVQFKQGNVLELVGAALERSGLPPALLELELTESILLQDVDSTMQTLHDLKALGVKLSIDDFGTGYSSLAYLKQLAVDKLKIDQSFVRDLLTDTDGTAIVQAIIQLGHTLQLEVIAEGVETEAQRTTLARFGCDQGQGYLFSHPLPPEQLEAFLK